MTDQTSSKPSKKPIVALVGRPNVGKSTLFNRLVEQRKAIIEDLAGTTRDRIYGESNWGGRDFIVVDTGGIEFGLPTLSRRQATDQPRATAGFQAGVASRLFLKEIRQQAEIAIAEAEVIVFLVDVETGVTGPDQDVANMLRQAHKPVLLAVNKADNQQRRQEAVEFYALGLGEPRPISAVHGRGVADLLDEILEVLPPAPEEVIEDESIKIAILGRPNVGKSSLLNKMLGEERVIVSSVPGTTRDAVDTRLEYQDEELVLIDTAGIRRRGKIEAGVEKYSFLRSLKAINRADVCLLLIDATQMVIAQDAHIASYILEEAKSVVVVVNKWDAVEDKDTHTMNEYTRHIRADLKFLEYVPLIFISAKTGQRVPQLLPLALQVYEERFRRIPTGELNRLVHEAVAKHPPKGGQRYRLKFYYATQPRIDPPLFVFFVNDRKLVHFTYQRYLENRLREQYGFVGTPLQLVFRNRKEKD